MQKDGCTLCDSVLLIDVHLILRTIDSFLEFRITEKVFVHWIFHVLLSSQFLVLLY